ncbi:ATP-binding protein [Pectobacterium polaris]|uniref:ATP-binding protein n=1 Tax=Pectobacterium polaris TaxID=2042057 RepID=UPI0032E46CA7
MGTIRTEVSESILAEYPEHRNFLTPFLNGFYVTWGRKRKEYNTELYIYFLSPEEHFKESYGLDNEILLVYAPYTRMEPRTIQAIEQIMSTSPAKGRVETLSYFLITDCNEMDKWLDEHLPSRQESRIIVPFLKSDLFEAKKNADDWFVRNKLNSHYFGRDLFNYTLPLIDDAYFFGRQSIMMEYYDSVKRRENKAVFGLRKTGKTSFLYKLKRLCENEGTADVFYYDCKIPHIRKSRWFELLEDIARDISENFSIKFSVQYTERTASKHFESLIKKLSLENKRILFILDEIEYISFVSPKDIHWKDDYIEFWQTMWSCQSRYKTLSFILAGVNPSVVEKDLVNGVQNPLFGIVSHKYLTGLNLDEVQTMLKKLGKRMGIRFQHDACDEIFKWYGGHPLLTRQACSCINTFLSGTFDKPIDVTLKEFNKNKENIDRELVFYSEHAVSEIRQFYPDEYYLFELLSIDHKLDFKELSRDSAEIKHLIGYQLIRENKGSYEINIPVIAKRVAFESKRQNGRDVVYPIIPSENRQQWLERRLIEICTGIRHLERYIKKTNQNLLFGPNSFPEADQVKSIDVATNESSFSFFINVVNRCFVESIDVYGKSLNVNDYYWRVIKNDYPELWMALDRVKVYRNERDHLHLNKTNSDKLDSYLTEDLEGKSFSSLAEPYFVLQQRVLDRLLLAILNEIDRYN